MKSIVTASTYRWIADSFETATILRESEQDVSKTPIPMPSNIGDAWFISMHLPLNVILRRVSHSFKPDMAGRLVPSGHISEQMAEPALIIQSLKSGRVVLSDARVEEEFVFGSNGCMFQHTDYLDHVIKVDTSSDILSFIVVIGDSVLSELLGKEYATGLFAGLHTEALPSAAVNRIPQHISAILYSSFPDRLTGNIRKLFSQAKVLEYISALAEHFDGQKEETKLTSDNKQIILKLREELMHLDGKLPTLDELGRRYGVSARLLNDEFKRFNKGQSIFSFISGYRLTEAHDALLKTNLPMKTIAANLGYSHVNNFIIAFGKKFGYSPGSLRKNA